MSLPIVSSTWNLKCGGTVSITGQGEVFLDNFKHGHFRLEPAEAKELVRCIAFFAERELILRGGRS